MGGVTPVGMAGEASRAEAPVRGRRLQAWEIGDDAPTMVQLRVDPSRVAWARKQFGPDVAVTDEPDGGAVFHVPVVMQSAFRSLVLEFLDHAEVLAPPEMRAATIAWLTDIAASNTGDIAS